MRTLVRSWSTVAALAIPCGLSGCGMGDGKWDDGFSGNPAEYAHEVFLRVNEERAAAGVPPLLWHETASSVAQAHSNDMDARHFFAHVNPDGLDPADRLEMAGVGCRVVGENIAEGQDDPDEVMAAWMGSSAHRANILSPEFTEIGIGVHGSQAGTWWTQDFFAP